MQNPLEDLVFWGLAMAIVGLMVGTAKAEFITPDAVLATTRYSSYPERNLINGNGLSANSASGTHRNSPSTMWLSSGGTVANEAVIVDLRNTYNLTQAYVWQYTETTARNTRTMDIYVSADNVTYTKVGGTVTLKTSAADNQTADVVPLSASNVRYVKFHILTSGAGTASGYIGLGEVRFEGTLVAPGESFITPTNVTATSYYTTNPGLPVSLINGSGLSDNNPWGTHSQLRGDTWLSASATVTNQNLVFALDDAYDLSRAYVWQCTETTERNTRTMDIYVSADNVTYTKVGGTVTLKTSAADNQTADVVPLSASNVRYVKFHILTSGAGTASGYVGLGEVRFEGVVHYPHGMVIIVR